MANRYRRKKKRNINLRLFTTLSLLITGSIVGYLALGDKEKTQEVSAPIVNQQSQEPSQKTEPPKENTEKPVTYMSPYTGEELTKEVLGNTPYLVIIENSRAARPQSGLSSADIVYETMAEGGVPRFLALFHSTSAQAIGPVRSARPYFLSLAKFYNLPFAHCGGSAEALDAISKENLMSLNEFSYGGYYWRDNSRKAPHNLYTSSEKLSRLIENKKYIQAPSSKLKFDKTFWQGGYASAQKLDIKLSPYYSTSYDFKDGLYYKNMDGQKIEDKNTGNQLTVTNIVIQVTDIKTLDSYGRLDIRQTGTGTGYVFSNGKYVKITWSKADDKSPIILKDEKGTEVSLLPGKTWWHLTDNKAKLEIK